MTSLTPARAPERDERAIVGGIEHGKGVQVLRLADIVEEAVRIRAVVRGREEGEGTCLW